MQGLRTHGMWIRAFAADSRTAGGYGAVHRPQISLDAPERVLDLAGRIATACWDQQRAVVPSSTATPPADLVSAEESALLLEFIGRINARSLLCVPMGAGRECLGYLALTRTAKAPAWSDEEIAAALAIGRDLGRAVLHARLFERERQLVEELQNLDRYKTDLIATISHELKNPLTSVMGHLELIQPVLAETSAARSLGAISRNAARLEMMVEDLLLLSKVGDPTRPLIPVEVDLVPLLDDTVEMLRIQTERRGVALQLDHPGTPVLAWGRPRRARAAGHQHRQQRDQVHALGPHRAGDARGARRPRHVHLPRRGARDLRRRTRSSCSPSSTGRATPRRSRCPAPVWG